MARAGGLCSTPFGITAVLTRNRVVQWADHVLLCSTPFGITAVLTAPGST